MNCDNIIEKANGIIIKDIHDFGIHETLDNGSTFRWFTNGSFHYGVVRNKMIVVGYVKGTNDLFIGNINKEEFKNYFRYYFDCDTDYDFYYNQIRNDNIELQKYLPKQSKLRLVNQDFLESFVCAYISQNNNIERIKQIVYRLCVKLGEPVEFSGLRSYTFPTLAQLCTLTEDDYKALGFGYRAKGMVVNMNFLASLNVKDFKEYFSTWEYKEVLGFLMNRQQIGPKVANFIISMSHISKNYEDAFVVDVWIKRALQDIFGVSYITQEWLDEHFKHKALAQQNLFYYYRGSK